MVCINYSCSDPEVNNPFGGDPSTAIDGTALYFSPSYYEANSVDEFTMYIYVQEVTNLIGAEIEFSYDTELVDFTSAVAGTLLEGASYNVFILEHNIDMGRVLLTLATAQDGGAGISEAGALVQLAFTPKSSGVLDLILDLPPEPDCPWHVGLSPNHSIYMEDSDPTSEQSFPSLINATIIIQ